MCTFRQFVVLVLQTHDINWAFITGRIAWDSAHWADYLSIIVIITRAAPAYEFNLFAPVGRRGKVEGVRRAFYRVAALRNCIDCREGCKFFFAFAVLLVIRYRRHGGRRFRGGGRSGCRRRGRSGRRRRRGGRGRGERCRRRGGRGRGRRCRRRGGRGRGGRCRRRGGRGRDSRAVRGGLVLVGLLIRQGFDGGVVPLLHRFHILRRKGVGGALRADGQSQTRQQAQSGQQCRCALQYRKFLCHQPALPYLTELIIPQPAVE